MTLNDFIDGVATTVPRARESLRKLLDDGLESYAVYVAAGELGEFAIALYERSESGADDRLTAILGLAEAGARDGVSQILDAIGTDFVPSIASTGPIPHKLFDMMGPSTQRIVRSDAYAVDHA